MIETKRESVCVREREGKRDRERGGEREIYYENRKEIYKGLRWKEHLMHNQKGKF